MGSWNLNSSSMKKIFFTIIFFSVIIPEINGQPESSISKDLAEWIEDTFSKNSKGEANAEQFLSSLQILAEHPININSADSHELSSIMFLDKFRIQSMIDYRTKNGEILSIYELALIPGFDERVAGMIEPFIYFGDKRETHFNSKGHHEIVLQGNRVLEKQRGYKEPRSFDGSPNKINLRYRYSSSKISAGYTADKDPGETFFKAPNKKSFDFNSGFLQISPNKNNTIFLGDYVVHFGQGLVAWQGFSIGASSQPMSMAKFNQGIKSYSSSGEYGYMRGIAFSGKYGKFSVIPFFSYQKIDASIDTIENEKVIISFPATGYHRTTGEIERKNAASVLSTGSRVSFDGKCYSLSINGYFNHYQNPIVRKSEYNRYYFNGNSIGNISIDYQYSLHHFFFYGEIATNFDKGWAAVSGVMANPTDKLELLAAYRNIGIHYNSAMAAPFTEGSAANDEEGLYIGARMMYIPDLTLNYYVDFFRYDRLKYTTAGPGNGYELAVYPEYSFNKKWQLSGKYFRECKPVKVTGEYSKININQIRQLLRFNLKGELSPSFSWKCRFDQSFYKHDHRSTGFMICEDIGYHTHDSKIVLWGRIGYFKTGDYDSRLYAYENDLLYNFSFPSLYGKGIRTYLTGKVKISKKIGIRIKYGEFWYFNDTQIGTSYYEIEGNRKKELKIQFRIKI